MDSDSITLPALRLEAEARVSPIGDRFSTPCKLIWRGHIDFVHEDLIAARLW